MFYSTYLVRIVLQLVRYPYDRPSSVFLMMKSHIRTVLKVFKLVVEIVFLLTKGALKFNIVVFVKVWHLNILSTEKIIFISK